MAAVKIPSQKKIARNALIVAVGLLVWFALSAAVHLALTFLLVGYGLFRIARAAYRTVNPAPAKTAPRRGAKATPKTTKTPAVKAASEIPPNAATDAQATAAVLRAVLKARTGRAWTVTAPTKGKDANVIRVSVPTERREFGGLGVFDQASLTHLSGQIVGPAGMTIPNSQEARARVLAAVARTN